MVCRSGLSLTSQPVVALHFPLPCTAVKLLDEEGRRLQRSRLKWRLQPVALYAGLPATHQLAVFEPAPRGVRKVRTVLRVVPCSLHDGLLLQEQTHIVQACMAAAFGSILD